MVLYYLASHDLKKIESHEFAMKRNKNSQDSVVITRPAKTLAEPLAASVKSSEPSNSAIKQHIANGGAVEGASVKRGYHLRIE